MCMFYHTFGGYVLRSFCTKNDSEMDKRDLGIFFAMGDVAETRTGYPCVSIFEWFTPDKSKPPRGSALEWAYETLGIFSFATELWDMRGRAGLDKKPAHTRHTWTFAEKEAEELALLRWNDEAMDGSLFVNWTEFQHPQLGNVEIGVKEPKVWAAESAGNLAKKNAGKTVCFYLIWLLCPPGSSFQRFLLYL